MEVEQRLTNSGDDPMRTLGIAPKTILRSLICVAAALLVCGGSARAATPKQVDEALNKAKAFLYSKQHDGNWETARERDNRVEAYSVNGGQWGGLTALATFALLAAGENAQSPQLAPALQWLKKADIVGVYALGFRAQIWPLLPPSVETRALAKADFQKLYQGINRTGDAAYLYTYFSNKPDPNQVDHSVSQLGVLGVWACAQTGLEVPGKYWEDVERRWIADQKPDGGWTYAQNPRVDPNPEHNREQASMTAAGVATLFITQDFARANDSGRCNGNIQNEHIDLGVRWLADHTDDWTDPIRISARGFSYVLPGYTLYGIERVGVASGLKYFGTIDWYQFGADWCVKNQGKDGSWGGAASFPNTALCMIFLARGRAPVLMNKLQYNMNDGNDKGKPGHWNQRPRDVANFTRWMGRQTEREFNWQIVNLDASADELSDAPFLYVSGNQSVSFTPEQKDKLRLFVHRGGMILVNGDCAPARAGESPFIISMSKLGMELFPEAGEFREIPASHPIYTRQQYNTAKWKAPFRLRGLSNGIREVMILMPQDPARSWQRQESVGAGHEVAYQAIANLVAYGTDKQILRTKGESLLVKPDPGIKTSRSIKVGRLKYTGPWDPEPAAWTRLATQVRNQNKVDVDVQTVELGKAPLDGFQLAALTGTTKFVPNTDQKSAIKKFVDGGGTLLIDAQGASSDFAGSIDAMLKELFPAGLSDPLPATDPVFTAGGTGAAIRYRPYAREMLGGAKVSQLRAIQINGRNAVYYSREDLTGGLVGEAVDGVIGYDPESATAIVSGIVMRTISPK